MMRIPRSLLVVTAFLVACGGSQDGAAPATDAATADAAPAATGKVITITMHTDEIGNYYLPAEVTAQPGDVLRFELVSGVHNVHFLADSNKTVTNLPPMTDMLQLPGQTVDVVVTMPAGGRYFYQCDPHALLGMVGYVTVTSGS